MNTCGIITEYNPMHLGHAYQLAEAKKVTNSKRTTLLMSGNFVQRGEPAIIDKYHRTRAALESGIDLVLELPTYFATSSAESFSHHSMAILNACGIITHLNYGSEHGDINELEAIADILYNEPPLGYKVLLNDYLAEGHSYPKSREMALLKYNDNHKILNKETIKLIQTPNNILGIEYIKALKRLNSHIKPTTIKRIGSTYHDDNSQVAIPSATALRKHINDTGNIDSLSSKMPEPSYLELKNAIGNGNGPLLYEDLFQGLKYKILVTPKSQLKLYQDVTEGLENRIYESALCASNYDDLISKVTTKRYTRTKIARALLHIFLGHTKENFQTLNTNMKPYIRVLGFTATGQSILKEIKSYNEDLPIIVNVRQGYKLLDDIQRISFKADLDATLLYNHMIHSKFGTLNKNDYQHQVIMI